MGRLSKQSGDDENDRNPNLVVMDPDILSEGKHPRSFYTTGLLMMNLRRMNGFIYPVSNSEIYGLVKLARASYCRIA